MEAELEEFLCACSAWRTCSAPLAPLRICDTASGYTQVRAPSREPACSTVRLLQDSQPPGERTRAKTGRAHQEICVFDSPNWSWETSWYLQDYPHTYTHAHTHTHTQVVYISVFLIFFPCKDFINMKKNSFFRRSKRQRNFSLFFFFTS